MRISAAVIALTVCIPAAASAQPLQELPLQPAALDTTRTFELRHIDPQLTGAGVNIALICYNRTRPDDYLLNTAHDCFAETSIKYAHNLSSDNGISPHATAIAGILVGNDPSAFHPGLGYFYYEGAAPEAKLKIYEHYRFWANYVASDGKFRADIISISWGEVLQGWTRWIERLAETRGTIAVAAVGNGKRVCDPVLYPAAGANVIGVGVVNSMKNSDLGLILTDFALPVAIDSSCGPTADDRCKPDLVAPGNCLVPDANNPSGYSSSGDYTSFSTPVVAGTAALLLQKARSEPDLLDAAGPAQNCVIKAILMNSAQKLPYWHKGSPGIEDDHEVALDYSQGAGLLDAVAAYDQLLAGRYQPGYTPANGWDNNVIEKQPGTEKAYFIDIEDPARQTITATLVWNRHYADQSPFDPRPHADSDLRLEIWAIDPQTGDYAYLLDYSDSINDNVEHIHTATDPDYTRYAIIVSFGEVPAPTENHPDERYALAWKTNPSQPKDHTLWYDLNLDGLIDDQDVISLLKTFAGKEGPVTGHRPGDINMDALIDIQDLTLLMAQIKTL